MTHILVGRVRKPQGIRGEVTIELLTESPDVIFAPGARVFAGTVEGDLARNPTDPRNPDSRHELTVESVSPFKEGLIVKFDAIPDRTAAELWRHRYLLVPEDEVEPLADDEVFVHELLDMAVRDQDGNPVGTVIGTYELPQGLTLDVQREQGSVLVPYNSMIVTEVDRDSRIITVDMNSGLFD